MKIVFATHNKNKFKEVLTLIPNGIELLSLNDINCLEDIAETESTIEGNAILKAKYIKLKYGYDCFADDTGLEVEALNGAPGVYSARYAGENSTSEENIKKLLLELEDRENRRAQFKTVIALCLNENTLLFEGICKGNILKSPMGSDGFGYDPIFKPLGYDQTFAQMDLSLKNEISHRGLAIKKLIAHLNSI